MAFVVFIWIFYHKLGGIITFNFKLHLMNWFTELSLPKSQFPISHQSKILSIGSCFALTFGQKMKASKLDVLVNPFGTIFQPIALSHLLQAAVNQRPIDQELILERDESFFYYHAHSDLVATSRAELIQKITRQQQQTADHVLAASHLILTLGTSYAYELIASNTLVANCHKQPANLFKKRLLGLEEMKIALKTAFEAILNKNPTVKIILTVSPVRHLKDGLTENQLSKSLLRVVCADLEDSFTNCTYFPAYEIMLDELRDYRFYKSDLIHPTEQAENHIWEKWSDAFFTPITKKKINQIAKINLDLQHRPLNPKGKKHQEFLQKLLDKLARLQPEFDFSSETKNIQAQLETFSELERS